MSQIAKILTQWYHDNGRALPWRETQDAYTIWISEVVLQQTRIAQGRAYFERFIERFPTVQELAAAPREAVVKAWEGLGYYTRAKNLHRAAQKVVENYGGQLPGDHQTLQELPGIGPYTARAIAAFAFGEQVAVVDGNVLRVISRVEGDATPIDEQKKHYQAKADAWLGEADSRLFNHAMMDFGAMVCTPRQPACTACPLQERCQAYAQSRVAELPRKAKQLQRKNRYFDYFLLRRKRDGKFLLKQRGEDQFWQNLWEPPHIERESPDAPLQCGTILGTLKHEFTHFRMYIRVIEANAEEWPAATQKANGVQNIAWVAAGEESQYALPRAVHRMLALQEKPQLPFNG